MTHAAGFPSRSPFLRKQLSFEIRLESPSSETQIAHLQRAAASHDFPGSVYAFFHRDAPTLLFPNSKAKEVKA